MYITLFIVNVNIKMYNLANIRMYNEQTYIDFNKCEGLIQKPCAVVYLALKNDKSSSLINKLLHGAILKSTYLPDKTKKVC